MLSGASVLEEHNAINANVHFAKKNWVRSVSRACPHPRHIWQTPDQADSGENDEQSAWTIEVQSWENIIYKTLWRIYRSCVYPV